MSKTFKLEQLLMPGVIEHLIEASVWSAKPVSEHPHVELESWQVLKLPGGEMHFVGWNATQGEGRVSSQVVDFDAGTRCGRTSSGRVYRLQGRTGHDADGAYVWRRWARINEVESFVDVSEQVQALIDSKQGSAS